VKSELTQNNDRDPLIELVDLLYVPGSLLRFARTKSIEGVFTAKDDDSKFMKAFSKAYPYIQASLLEGLRLYSYYYMGSLIINKFL
jgi:hypothetical protein